MPEHRADLYRRYIEELLTTWEYRRRPREGAEGKPAFRLGPLEDRQARDAALQGVFLLGWRMHLIYHGSRGEELPSRKSLTTYLAERLKPCWALSEGDAQAVADAVLSFWEEAGLIDRWYIEGTEYLAFRHLTFQEYAAARVLCDLWQERPKRTWAFLRPRLHHPHWHEVLLLMAAMLDDATTLVEHVWKARSAYERELHRDLFVAADLVGEGAPVQEGLRRKLAHALQRLLSPWPRRLSFVVLGVTFLSGSIAAWYALLSARCAFVLLLAGWVFIWLGCVRGIFPRPRALLWFPSRAFSPAPVEHEHVVRSLGQLGDPRALEPLLHALRDENRRVREAAAWALDELGWHPTQPVEKAWYLLARRQWDLLVQLGDVALEPFLQALRDRNAGVRWAAAQALGQLGDVALNPLLHALRDENRRVREAAAWALGRLGDPRALPPFLHALRDEDTGVRWAAAQALGQLGDVALNPLLHALRDENRRVREAAAWALGRLGDPRALPPLLHALRDEDWRVREAAAWALGQLGDPRALAPLLQSLRDWDGDVRKAAARAFRPLGDVALAPLLHALRDRDADMREAAAQVLDQLEWRPTHPAEKAWYLLARRQWDLLVQLGDVALEPLLHALRDEDTGVRWAAAQALGQLGDVALNPLLHALRDENRRVREAAAWALGRLGDPRALPPLLHALRDEDASVRWAAAQALGKLGTPRALTPLLYTLRDENQRVREAAAWALGQLVNRVDNWAQCRRVARALWWRLTDVEGVARAALAALQQTATRLTELTVESLPFDDPLLPGQLPRWKALLNRSRVGLSIVLSALAGLVGGVISNNFTNVPLLWAVIVFVLTLLLQIALALRQLSEASP